MITVYEPCRDGDHADCVVTLDREAIDDIGEIAAACACLCHATWGVGAPHQYGDTGVVVRANGGSGHAIATLWGAEREKHARLIAASPGMYALIRAIVDDEWEYMDPHLEQRAAQLLAQMGDQ